GGGPLFLLDRTLTLDAVAGEGQRLEPLFGDGLATALAVTEAALVDLLQRGDHFLEETPIAVTQLEQELPVVRGARLVTQVLDGIVLGPLAVHDVPPHFLDELVLLLFQLLAEVRQPILPHRRLLPPAPKSQRAP